MVIIQNSEIKKEHFQLIRHPKPWKIKEGTIDGKKRISPCSEENSKWVSQGNSGNYSCCCNCWEKIGAPGGDHMKDTKRKKKNTWKRS